MTDSREELGRLVRAVWTEWAGEQPDPKPSWLLPWEALDAGQREVDMRIGATVAAVAVASAREADIMAGPVTIGAAEYEQLLEIKAGAEGRFPRCLIVKPEPGRDLYVGWSEVCEMPAAMWTRAEALADGCPPSRLRRADETGTSSIPGFYRWDSGGMIAEQRGWLPRARLADYAAAYLDGRLSDCWDMLEPLDGETEVRRH